jgi:hypothetical protein
MTIKTILGAGKYEEIRNALRGAFPDPRASIDDDVVDHCVEAMQLNYRPEYAKIGVVQDTNLVTQATRSAIGAKPITGFTYYLAHAEHHRLKQSVGDKPVTSKFVGKLPCVMYSLPDVWKDTIETGIGQIFSGDHLLYDLETFGKHYEKKLGFRPKKVNVVTPARQAGARFGAIACYIAFREEGDTKPVAYVLEAGMATGEPMVLYLSDPKDMDAELVRRSWYVPTPFSSSENSYHGKLTFDADGGPAQLVVESWKKGDTDPYIRITVDYEKKDVPVAMYPAFLTLQAALRVAAIADAQGIEVPGMGVLTPVFAALGRDLLDWSDKP